MEMMENCPVCNTKLTDQTVCRRCKADLGKLIRMGEDARTHEEKARKAFEENRYHDMYYHARRYRSVRSTPESSRLLASAAMLIGKIDLAYTLWRQCQVNADVPV